MLFRLNRVLGSSPEQTAKAFLVADETVASWNIRVDKAGDQALVQIAQPVNKLPDLVRGMVQRPILFGTRFAHAVLFHLARG